MNKRKKRKKEISNNQQVKQTNKGSIKKRVYYKRIRREAKKAYTICIKLALI